jgi:hypothetical protein
MKRDDRSRDGPVRAGARPGSRAGRRKRKRRRADRSWSRTRSRDCSASGSGMPPRGGSGGDGGCRGPHPPPPSSPSDGPGGGPQPGKNILRASMIAAIIETTMSGPNALPMPSEVLESKTIAATMNATSGDSRRRSSTHRRTRTASFNRRSGIDVIVALDRPRGVRFRRSRPVGAVSICAGFWARAPALAWAGARTPAATPAGDGRGPAGVTARRPAAGFRPAERSASATGPGGRPHHHRHRHRHPRLTAAAASPDPGTGSPG